MSALGWELVQAHLLKSIPALKFAELNGRGNDTVEAVRYSPREQAIWFNQTQRFRPAPQEVWGFHIGAYAVLEKYLKIPQGPRALARRNRARARHRPRALLHHRANGEDRWGL